MKFKNITKIGILKKIKMRDFQFAANTGLFGLKLQKIFGPVANVKVNWKVFRENLQ